MSKGLGTCAGLRVRVERVRVWVIKLSPVTYPYPFGRAGCDINLASSQNQGRSAVDNM